MHFVQHAQLTTSTGTSYSSPKLTISRDRNMQPLFRSCPINVYGWRLHDHYSKGDNSSLKNINFNLDSFCQIDSRIGAIGHADSTSGLIFELSLLLHCQFGSIFQNSWFHLKKRTIVSKILHLLSKHILSLNSLCVFVYVINYNLSKQRHIAQIVWFTKRSSENTNHSSKFSAS